MWSFFRSILVSKIPKFREKNLIWTTDNTFLEGKYPKDTENPYYVYFHEVSRKSLFLLIKYM